MKRYLALATAALFSLFALPALADEVYLPDCPTCVNLGSGSGSFGFHFNADTMAELNGEVFGGSMTDGTGITEQMTTANTLYSGLAEVGTYGTLPVTEDCECGLPSLGAYFNVDQVGAIHTTGHVVAGESAHSFSGGTINFDSWVGGLGDGSYWYENDGGS